MVKALLITPGNYNAINKLIIRSEMKISTIDKSIRGDLNPVELNAL